MIIKCKRLGLNNPTEVETNNKTLVTQGLSIEKLSKVWKNGSDGWLQQKVFNLINDRYNAMRPMIFSSNYTLMDLLAKHYDRATIDRIREMNEQIEVKGENWR